MSSVAMYFSLSILVLNFFTVGNCFTLLRVPLSKYYSGRSAFHCFPNDKKTVVSVLSVGLSFFFSTPLVSATSMDLKQEVYEYERILIEEAKQPKLIMQKMNRDLQPNKKIQKMKISDSQIDDSRNRILTLKAYLDEIERDIFRKSWDRLQSYLYVFSEQEEAFAVLIEGLFPLENELDSSARLALSFEAKGVFLALDDLRQAARDQQVKPAQSAYARLALSYDRFLKAGDLYPAYDPLTSTEVFYRQYPQEMLRYDRSKKIDIWSQVLLITGPDMGKTGKILDFNGNYAVVKFDANGLPFQEVKLVKKDYLAQTLVTDDSTGEVSKPPPTTSP